MHLKYPKRKLFYLWEELSCLSRALGFHHEVIEACLPSEIVRKEEGISHRELMKFINLKFFNDALDRSANMHTADYNINVLKKSIELLNHRLLSFDELSDVRVAFQVYEAGDMRGMVIDQHTLMRTLKLSGRTVAPLKLMHRVKHMEGRLDEPGRLQLYEFLDLIVLCELSDNISVPDPKHRPLDKTWRKLFEIDNFEQVFATYDEKLEAYMNSMFVQEERNYGKEQLGSTRIPKEASVETSARKKLVYMIFFISFSGSHCVLKEVKYHKKKYKELHESISQSTAELKKTKAGIIRPRPVTAPDVEEFRLPSRMSSMSTQSHGTTPRPHTVAECFHSPHDYVSWLFASRPYTAPATTSSKSVDSRNNHDPRIHLLLDMHKRKTLQSQPSRKVGGSTSAPQLGGGHRRTKDPLPWMTPSAARVQTPQVVTEKDVCRRQRLLDSLQYEIETLEERTFQQLEDQLMRTVPQYKQRKAAEREQAEKERLEAELRAQKKKVKKKFPIQEEKKTDPVAFGRITHPTPKSFYKEHYKNCSSSKQIAGPLPPKVDPKSVDLIKLSSQPKHPVTGQDGRHVDVGFSFQRGINESTSSVSSMDEISTATQTTDITKHVIPVPSVTPHQGVFGYPSKFGSRQFEGSRVGTAALLYDYLSADSDTDREESVRRAPQIMTEMKDKEDTKVDELSGTNQGPGKGDTLSITDVKSNLREPTRPASQLRTPDFRKVHWDKTKVSRKVTVFDDDELKLYGVPLSEIDKLTQKSESVDLQDLSQIQAAIGGGYMFP
ncbi:hypothetical protein HOLleu_36065 [Holothuria leucospilota]|uniref:Uncharacterized protein n=1 Tax=Holothuria leucospilota TaxID=206669 RepID=A0A9Q1BDD8_HOLLE|nr:hypothetical protein HOLleu_36065 [Holothuria leucospilota]